MCLKKVTTFITRNNGKEKQLLLFKHPHAGIQIPAGTIERDEANEVAALREAFEETGLDNIKVMCEIGCLTTCLPENKYVVIEKSNIFSRPDLNSFDWASFRRGITIEHHANSEKGFKHVTYKEYDNVENPSYITYQITGWIPENCIAKEITRYFYHLEAKSDTDDSWEISADNHIFEFFWAPINDLPKIVSPQDEWVSYAKEHLKYKF
ncbi:MAG: NUDIX domain-containing protein [Defluviitaleaceae bacterium]|nr:NUDIX domain-containing protein [Defluviitaleaceae bacterium]